MFCCASRKEGSSSKKIEDDAQHAAGLGQGSVLPISTYMINIKDGKSYRWNY